VGKFGRGKMFESNLICDYAHLYDHVEMLSIGKEAEFASRLCAMRLMYNGYVHGLSV
jgi:hypothetical protein